VGEIAFFEAAALIVYSDAKDAVNDSPLNPSVSVLLHSLNDSFIETKPIITSFVASHNIFFAPIF